MILTSFLKLREEIMSKIICIYPATGISTVSIEENNIHEFSAQIIFWTVLQGKLKMQKMIWRKSLLFCIVLRDKNY